MYRVLGPCQICKRLSGGSINSCHGPVTIRTNIALARDAHRLAKLVGGWVM